LKTVNGRNWFQSDCKQKGQFICGGAETGVCLREKVLTEWRTRKLAKFEIWLRSAIKTAKRGKLEQPGFAKYQELWRKMPMTFGIGWSSVQKKITVWESCLRYINGRVDIDGRNGSDSGFCLPQQGQLGMSRRWMQPVLEEDWRKFHQNEQSEHPWRIGTQLKREGNPLDEISIRLVLAFLLVVWNRFFSPGFVFRYSLIGEMIDPFKGRSQFERNTQTSSLRLVLDSMKRGGQGLCVFDWPMWYFRIASPNEIESVIGQHRDKLQDQADRELICHVLLCFVRLSSMHKSRSIPIDLIKPSMRELSHGRQDSPTMNALRFLAVSWQIIGKSSPKKAILNYSSCQFLENPNDNSSQSKLRSSRSLFPPP
jgi:hypothetical protein